MARHTDPRFTSSTYLASIEEHENRHKESSSSPKTVDTGEDRYWKTLDIAKGIQCYKDVLEETFRKNYPAWIKSMRLNDERLSKTEERHLALITLANGDRFIPASEVIVFLDSYHRDDNQWAQVITIANDHLQGFERKVTLTDDILKDMRDSVYPVDLLTGLAQCSPSTTNNILKYYDVLHHISRVERTKQKPFQVNESFHKAYRAREEGEKQARKERLSAEAVRKEQLAKSPPVKKKSGMKNTVVGSAAAFCLLLGSAQSDTAAATEHRWQSMLSVPVGTWVDDAARNVKFVDAGLAQEVQAPSAPKTDHGDILKLLIETGTPKYRSIAFKEAPKPPSKPDHGDILKLLIETGTPKNRAMLVEPISIGDTSPWFRNEATTKGTWEGIDITFN